MNNRLLLNGKIVSGVEQGAFFTQLDWFQKQCAEKLGYVPYPGTLNLELSSEDIPKVEVIEQKSEIEFIPPDSTFCSGRAYPVDIEGIRAAIIMPAEQVRVHGKNIIEVISEVKLKDALGADDGDSVELIVDIAIPKII
ncbi:MAG: CTP-dependent riboflavin kinase [Desulfobacterales bacterium]|jgi:CTP-dependent riboflavin kinase